MGLVPGANDLLWLVERHQANITGGMRKRDYYYYYYFFLFFLLKFVSHQHIYFVFHNIVLVLLFCARL
jgi:hypothetical protein